jgi:predicted transcriptional regulator
MEDRELISALKAHYPISVQKIRSAKRPRNVEEVVSFLKQMDEIEGRDQNHRTGREAPGESNSQNY